MIRNQHWYDLNDSRQYPLADSASGIGDSGTYINNAIIADLNITWPEEYGKYAYLTSLAITPFLITATVSAIPDPTTNEDAVPILAISQKRPVDKFRQYAITSLADGVGGWVVFGGGVIGNEYNDKFSSPVQSLLAPKAARHYRRYRVKSLNVAGTQISLKGMVQLPSLAPLKWSLEEREIQGDTKQCLVLSLVEQYVGSTVSKLTNYKNRKELKDSSIFAKFAGPCAKNPDSYTCDDPQPVEFINGIGPDCSGQVELEFLGCVDVVPLENGHGVIVSCQTGLDTACGKDNLPTAGGRLPGQYDPQETSASSDSFVSESLPGDSDVPFLDCFGDGNYAGFSVASGSWLLGADNSPGEVGCTGSAHSVESDNRWSSGILVWDGSITSMGRRVTSDILLPDADIGMLSNGGVVFNYKGSTNELYVATIDYVEKTFSLLRIVGGYQTDVGYILLPEIAKNVWYRVQVDIEPAAGDSATVTATLSTVAPTTLVATLGPVVLPGYRPSTGKFGFYANRAYAKFSFLEVTAL